MSFFLRTLSPIDVISGIGDALHYLYLDLAGNSDFIQSLLVKYLDDGFDDAFDSYLMELTLGCHSIKKNVYRI